MCCVYPKISSDQNHRPDSSDLSEYSPIFFIFVLARRLFCGSKAVVNSRLQVFFFLGGGGITYLGIEIDEFFNVLCVLGFYEELGFGGGE